MKDTLDYLKPAKKKHSYLWRIIPINGEGVPSYAFGTIHLYHELFLPHLPGNIFEAIKVNCKRRIWHVIQTG